MTPFVKRSRHHRAMLRMQEQLQRVENEMRRERREKEELGRLFLCRPPLASTAHYVVRVPIDDATTDELCLFVTHASGAELKPHVVDHIEALHDEGIDVVLIANTVDEGATLQMPSKLAMRLRGLIIRENVGYDFGAWAHAYTMIDVARVRKRLYLVNDSMIGPLDRSLYRTLLKGVRSSPADVVGLTANPDPHEHLQSYFLALNDRALRSTVLDTFMRQVVNMTRKQDVIDCYEIWLTPLFRRHDLVCTAIFPNVAKLPPCRDDTLYNWRELIELGLPFIKASVLRGPSGTDAKRFLAERGRR